MRSLLFLTLVTLAFSYDLSGKKVIWSDGLSAHISLTAVTPRPSTYTITAANLTTCTNWDACDPKNANPYYKVIDPFEGDETDDDSERRSGRREHLDDQI